jgi:hypothetical protein
VLGGLHAPLVAVALAALVELAAHIAKPTC